MARLIQADGTNTRIEPKNKEKGFRFEGELYRILKTDIIQRITLLTGDIMLMDEEGKQKQKPYNQTATYLFWLAGGRRSDHVVGDVVCCKETELH